MKDHQQEPIGTTAEQQIAEFAAHLEYDLFDILSGDVEGEDVPAEPELDLSKPVEKKKAAIVSATVKDPMTGKSLNLTPKLIAVTTSKTALRQIIATLVLTKPSEAATKINLLVLLNQAVSRLNELSGHND